MVVFHIFFGGDETSNRGSSVSTEASRWRIARGRSCPVLRSWRLTRRWSWAAARGPTSKDPGEARFLVGRNMKKKTLSRCFGVKTPGCCELGATKRVNMNWESMTMQRKDNSKHVWEVVESLLSKRRHYPPLIKGVGKSSVPRISNSNKPSMIRPCYIFSIVFLVSLSPISLIWPYLHIYVYVCDINTVHIHTI